MGSPASISPTSGSSSGPNGDWSNQAGVYQADINAAVCSPGSETTTDTLSAGGFPANQLPANAVIQGLQVGGHAWAATASTVQCYQLFLSVNGHFSSNLDGTSILSTTTGAGLQYGSSSTQPAGMSVSAADVNSGVITITLQFQGIGGGSGMSQIKASLWGITVWYTQVNQVEPKCITIRPGYVERD